MGELSHWTRQPSFTSATQKLQTHSTQLWLQPSVETAYFYWNRTRRGQSPSQRSQNRSSELNLSPFPYLSRKSESYWDGQYDKPHPNKATTSTALRAYCLGEMPLSLCKAPISKTAILLKTLLCLFPISSLISTASYLRHIKNSPQAFSFPALKHNSPHLLQRQSLVHFTSSIHTPVLSFLWCLDKHKHWTCCLPRGSHPHTATGHAVRLVALHPHTVTEHAVRPVALIHTLPLDMLSAPWLSIHTRHWTCCPPCGSPSTHTPPLCIHLWIPIFAMLIVLLPRQSSPGHIFC